MPQDLTLAEVLRLDWVRKRTQQLGWAPTPTNVVGLKHEMVQSYLTERVQRYLDKAFDHWQESCVLRSADHNVIEGFEAEPGMEVTYTSSASGKQCGARVLTKHTDSPDDS